MASKIDRVAMQSAIATVRARDQQCCEQIDSMRRTDSFEEVGRFAAYSCQSDNLGLKPWQTAPVWVGDLATALRQPFGDPRADREAAELLQRMLAAGLSKFEPDPLAAIAKAERATAT